MLGITGMQAAGLQERMAGHSRDRTIAFQAAESALRTAERAAMFTNPLDYTATCALALCAPGASPDPFTYAWNDTQSIAIDRTVAANQLSSDLAANPRYFLEYAGTVKVPGGSINGANTFRVTTRAVGQNALSAVMLQSFIRP